MSFTESSDRSAKKADHLKKIYYYEVALPLSLGKNLIYSSYDLFQKGDSVWVPLKSRKRSGLILRRELSSIKKKFDVKPILSLNFDRERLSPARMKWLYWLAEYYQYDLGLVLHLSFPPAGAFSKKPVSKTSSLKAVQHPSSPKFSPEALKPSLTEEQKKCLKEIQFSIKWGAEPDGPNQEIKTGEENAGFRVHLLHGVTGSGKTEIYFRLVEPALHRNESVLILVPEIALTPQHIERFSLRFPGQVACFHSGLSPKDKYQQWMSILKGEKKILIGPRSALFCPLPHLAWIIVDEEHESHFKQDEKLKYHGRDAAIYLGKCLNVPVVLASATPSMESWWNVQSGKYMYHRLKKRVFKTKVPKIEVVDMKKEKKGSDLPYWLSVPLYKSLKESLKRKEQAALFLNRRGENSLFCPACVYHFSCANCDISLTQHQSSHLLCHYCGFREEKPKTCPECGGTELFSFGIGTARLQKELEKLFPLARIVRADRDAVKNHKEWAYILNKIEKREVDMVIGTQMIAKGLDFPYLNLVGVILADQGLSRPDFRSAEKSFQLITQMAGRAGRREKPGRVILQSYHPSHPVVTFLKEGNYEKFSERELDLRKKYKYPPFGKLSLVRIQSISASLAFNVGLKIGAELKNIKNIEVLGPAPAPYFRLRNKYRYHLLLKSEKAGLLKQAGELILNSVKKGKPSAVRVDINRDPVYMF
ncbi:MAG: primosomal protein N' [Bdellovibrionales bacterium]|nr:primosomal protein N' [Bdellovibrionales bacterium]